jgi:hypothetical protein
MINTMLLIISQLNNAEKSSTVKGRCVGFNRRLIR